METENQEDKSRNTVWESRERGTRFMTTFTKGKVNKDTENHILIGENLSYDDALILCRVTENKNIGSFLGDIPEELRNPRMDALIANMIKTGK